jgi:ascorbate-specific PTS system EIIC-type component UlaA
MENETVTQYLGILHHSMLVPSITMTLLYIGMGVYGNFPPSP